MTFHGYVHDDTKSALLARASVHVCASDAEGWGQTAIEAAGHGVPTLARDVPGLRDSIRAEETGWLVPEASDLDEVGRGLTAQLRAVLARAEDPMARAQWFEACQAWAHQFDWTRMRSEARDLVARELSQRHVAGTPVPVAQPSPRDVRAAVVGGTTCVE